MCHRTTRRHSAKQQVTWPADRLPVRSWRQRGRLAVLRDLADAADGLPLSSRLLQLLLEELHVSDDFDALVGPVGRVPASHRPWLLAVAVLVRHSWCPGDLARTAARVGLLRANHTRSAHLTTQLTSRDGGHRRRAHAGASSSGPRTRSH
jgi:hypothetical protein